MIKTSELDDIFIRNEIAELLKKAKAHPTAPLFLQPIEEVIATYHNYADVVKEPIDLDKIIAKFETKKYTSIDEVKNDFYLMLNNCKTFNNFKKSWAFRSAEQLENYFNRELKKSMAKIEKHQINLQNIMKASSAGNANTGASNITSPFDMADSSNIQVVSSSEDEKIAKRIRNLFQKLGPNLNVSDHQRDEIIALIVRSIVKRSKSFEQIYEDTMKFLTKNLNNVNNIKSYFSRKFRKLLRSIKEDQSEGLKPSDKTFNIKINLNESEEKREEKDKLDQVRREVINFIDNQKVPEVFRNVTEYPLEPSLRRKITLHVNDIKNMFITKPKVKGVVTPETKEV